jgi:hypothetical protein
LCGSEAVPSNGLCIVLRYTFIVLKHAAQAELSFNIPLRGGKAVPSDGLCFVFCYTLTKHDTQAELSI